MLCENCTIESDLGLLDGAFFAVASRPFHSAVFINLHEF